MHQTRSPRHGSFFAGPASSALLQWTPDHPVASPTAGCGSNGARRHKPLLPVNCAAIPEALIESELFGHEKGAFTGAGEARKGLFQAAEGGTLFIDEIGEMPLGLQSKLLRALENKKIRPVGGTREVSVDVRLIAATNRDLNKIVKRREFREDLY